MESPSMIRSPCYMAAVPTDSSEVAWELAGAAQ